MGTLDQSLKSLRSSQAYWPSFRKTAVSRQIGQLRAWGESISLALNSPGAGGCARCSASPRAWCIVAWGWQGFQLGSLDQLVPGRWICMRGGWKGKSHASLPWTNLWGPFYSWMNPGPKSHSRPIPTPPPIPHHWNLWICYVAKGTFYVIKVITILN